MSETIDALEAWWPPTLIPLGFSRTRLAWWTIAVASHRTRRWTASRTSRSTSGAWARASAVVTARASHVHDHPGMHRAVLALAAVAVGVAACGGDGSKGPAAPEPVSGLFAAAGARLFIDCRGTGRRTVVLDSGLGVDSASTWGLVRPAVARFARVCLYDRAGMGSSPAGPRPRTSQRMVDELRALLRAAGVPPPYVLVGASFGGLNAQLFASEHPREVAGVVLVDGLHPDLDRRIEAILGPRASAERRAALARNGEGVRFADILASDAEVRAHRAFPDVPLIALKHGVSFDPGGRPDPRVERMWGALQRANAARSPQGRVVRAVQSHHRIAEDDPALVVAAIREVSSG
jgi:pimeloyl-ACP methyl ester carboxylesterase